MANQESRLAIVIDSKQAEQNIKRLRTALKNVGKESIDAGAGLELLNGSMKPLQKYDELFSSAAKASKEMTKSVRLLSKETVTASKGFSQITSKAKASAAATKNLGGVMSSTAQKVNKIGTETQKTTREMQRADATANKLSSTMSKLKNIVAGAFVGIGVSSILQTADTMQSLNSQVRLVTNSISEFNAVQSQLGSIANKQYTDIESLTQLYTRSRRALEQLGKTQQQTLDFTNNIAMAMRVGGASAQEQSAALLQLSQALASGVLRGDEFNSIAEQAPILLSLVAKEMGVAQGALRELAADGKITSEIVYNAVANATGSLEDMASKMPTTVGQALTVLQNNYKEFVGNLLNDTTGVSGALAKVITVVANNFSNLITVVAGGAVVWGAYAAANSAFVTTTIPALIAGVQTSIASIMAQSTAIQASIASTLSLATMQEFLTATTYRLQQARVVATLTLLNYKLALFESIAVVRAKTASVLGAIAVQAQYALSIATSGNLLNILTMSIAGAATSLIAKTTATLAAIRANVSYATSLVATHGVLGATAIGVTNLTRAIIAKTIAMGNAVRQTSIYSLALKGLGGATKVAGGAFVGLGSAVAKVASVLRAHPILAIAGVLFTVISATDGLSKAMESLSDAIAVVGIMFADFVKSAVGWITGLAKTFNKWVTGFIQGSVDGVNESASAFGWMFNTTEKGFLGLLQVIANVFDGAAKVVGTFVVTVGKGVYNLGISIKNNAAAMANTLIDGFNWAARAISNVLNSISRNANKVINLLNKIPNVNIPTWKQDFDLTTQVHFSSSQKLDNSIKGNWDSVSRVVDLYGTRARVDNAIYRHSYGKLRDENAVNESLDLASAINGVGNALDDAGKKGKKAGEKTAKGVKRAKEQLSEAQKAAEALNKSFLNAQQGLQRELNLIGQDTKLADWLYDLNDPMHELYNLAERGKDVLKELAASIDVSKLSYDLGKSNNELRHQMQLLEATTDLDKEKLSIQFESAKLLEKYEVFNRDGLRHVYDEIKAEISLNEELQKELALKRVIATTDKELSDATADLNKQIFLFGNDNPLSAFLYDLNETKKYANASKEAVTELEAAIRRLESIKRGDAMSAMVTGLYEQSPLEKLKAEQDERLRIIQESMIAEGGMKQAHRDALLAIDEKYQEDLRRLETAQYQKRAGAFAGLAKVLIGEHSKLYHTLFWIEKGYALQKAWLDSKKAVLDAYANTPGDTIAKMIAAAKAAVDTGLMTAAITAINPKGFKKGGYTGNLPTNAIAGAVHGQEYVFDANATKRIGVDNLERIRKGKPVNDTPSVNITVNVDAKGNTQIDEQNANNMSRRMAQGMKAVALEVIRQEKRQGGILSV